MLRPESFCVAWSRLAHSNQRTLSVWKGRHVGVISCWPFNLSSKEFTTNDGAQPADAIRILLVVYREPPGESSLEGILVGSADGSGRTDNPVGRIERTVLLSGTVWVGGGRTYRGEVDTAETSGGLQASRSKPGMHTVLSTRSPFCTYSPGGVNSPHQRTIGLPAPVSQERPPHPYEPLTCVCRRVTETR